MDEQQWRDERDDRTLRYAARRLDPNRWITLTADTEYLRRYDGQVALLTAANLLSRMSPSIAFAFPDVRIDSKLPWRDQYLHEVAFAQMRSADPFGRFCVRPPKAGDYRLHFGRNNHGIVVHGVGWNAYSGVAPSPLPLPDDKQDNPIGAALASILAVSRLFVLDFGLPVDSVLVNALDWRNCLAPTNPALPVGGLGNIWFVGVGSVGTATLYFLTLSGRCFDPTLLDMDKVKRQNIDRSPIFIEDDIGLLKVEAAKRFLAEIGLSDIPSDSLPLHESGLWLNRPPAELDILISAANEMNVRYHIEAGSPPIQLYGTTGKNWQASMIRHIPLVDACSCCLFPGDVPAPATVCASAPAIANEDEPKVDAALPFLSFAAGLMTATEVLKLNIPGYPFSANRVSLGTRPAPRLVPARIPIRHGCVCGDRSLNVHRKMIEGSKYASLSLAVEPV